MRTSFRLWTMLLIGLLTAAIVAVVLQQTPLFVAAQGPRLNYGDTVEGRISTTGQLDQWAFGGSQGDLITLEVQQTSGGLIPRIALNAPDGTLLASTEAPDPSIPRAKFTTMLRHNGQHTITVSGANNSTGSYALALKLDKPSTVSADGGTGVTSYGRTVSGIISNDVFRQFWAFQGGRGDVIDVRMTTTSGDLDGYLSLLNPEGLEIAVSDAGDANNNAALLAVELPSGGTYTLVARRAGANFGERGVTQGTYDLTLSLRAAGVNPNTVTPVALNPGSEIRGRLTADAPSALYAISASGVLALRLEFTDPMWIGSVAVMTPDRVLLKTFSGISPLHASVSLAGLNEVWIEVSTGGLQGNQLLDYSLLVNSLATAKRSAEPLIFGQPIEVSDPFSAPESWYFTGRAGDSVRLSISSFGPVLDAKIRITDPNGQPVIEDVVRPHWQQSLVLSENGPYELSLSEIVAATGYQIQVDRMGINGYAFGQMSIPQRRGTLAANAPAQGELAAGQADLWVMEVDGPQVWRFNLSHPGRPTPLGIEIQSPDGAPLMTSLSSLLSYTASAQVMLPSAGLYRVITFEPTLNAGSSYSLSAYPVEGGVILADTPHKGVLTPANPGDTWRVSLRAGSLLNIHLDTLTANASPSILVVAPNGQVVASTYYDEGQANRDLLGVRIDRGGSYRVIIAQTGLQQTAIYRITVRPTTVPEPSAITLSTEDRPVAQLFSSTAAPTPKPESISVTDLLSPAWVPGQAGLPTAQTGSLDTLLRGEIDPQSRQQVWSFTLNNPQTVLITVAALDSEQRPSITVTDAQGRVLADALQNENTLQDLWYRFASAGTDYVIVRFANDAGGRYTLWVHPVTGLAETVPNVLEGRVTAYGETRVDEIAPFSDGKISVFYGGSGDVITASVRKLSGDSVPTLQLLDAAQNVLASGVESADLTVMVLDSYTLPSEGMYALKVAPAESQPNATRYALYLDTRRMSAADRRGGVVCEGAQVSTLSTSNSRQRWLFDAQAGERIGIAVEPLSAGSPTPLEVALTDSAGNIFLRKESQLGRSALTLNGVLLPRSGIYQVIVSGGQQAGGAYRLTLERDHWHIQDDHSALSYGETAGKVLTRDNFLDVWTFAGSRGDVISVTARVVRGDPAFLNMQLRAYNGQILGTVADDPAVGASHLDRLILPYDGHYSLIVGNPDGSFDGESAYEISVRLENSRARSVGAVIDYGETREGRLYVDDSSDIWLFEAQQADTASVVLETFDSTLAPTISIVSTDWQTPLANALPEVFASAQALPGRPAQIDWQVPLNGTYAIYVQSSDNSSGRYQLQLMSTISETAQSRALVPGIVQSGEIGDERPMEYWTLSNAALSSVSVRVVPDIRANLAPTIELLGPDGAVVARADAQPSEQAILEKVQLRSIGEYSVRVARALEGEGTTRGAYTIAVETSTNESPAANAIGYNQLEAGALSETVNGQWWSFEGKQGTVVRLRVETTSGTLDPEVKLFNRAGQLIAAQDDQTESTNVEMFTSLPADDTYLVLVQRYRGALGSTQGNYLITIDPVYQLEPLSSTQFIVYGDRITGSTDNQRRVESWTFSGQGGDVIQAKIQFPVDDAPLSLVLRDPAGRELATGTRDRGDVLIASYTLPTDGFYLLDVQRPNDARSVFNPYTLDLTLLDTTATQPVQGGFLILGESVTGTFTEAQESHIWMFEGQGKTTARLTLSRLNGPLALKLALFAPDGTTLFTTATLSGITNVFTTDSLLLPVDGLYLLVITHSAQADPGLSYRLSLRPNTEAVTPKATLSVGQDGFGTLTDLHPSDQWEFTAQAGDVVTLRAATISGDLLPAVTILRPDGIPLKQAALEKVTDQWQAVIDRVLIPETGTYTAIIGRDASSSGQYRLMLRSERISPQAALASDIAYGQRALLTLPTTGEAYYAFQGVAGDVIGLAIGDVTGKAEAEIQTEAGDILATASVESNGEVILPALAVPETGRYIIRITHQDGETLSLVAFRRANTVPQEGVVRALSRGQTLAEGILSPAQITQWEFSGRAGEVLSFSVDTTGGRLRADLALYGPVGYLGSAVERAGSRVTRLGPVRLPVDGDYRLIVQPWLGASSGSYTVRAEQAGPGVSGSTGQHLAARNVTGYGGLISEDPEDLWTFDGEAGEIVSIRAEQTQGEGTLNIRVDGPSDSWHVNGVTSTAFIGAEIESIALPEDGRYRLTITGQVNQGEALEYRIGIVRVQSSIAAELRDAQGIAYGEQKTGQFDASTADNRAWVFFGQRGDTIRSTVTPLTPDFVPMLYLIDPRGEIVYLASGERAGQMIELRDVTLATDGFYGLVVKMAQKSQGGTDRAEFSLDLEKLPVRALLQGTITQGNQTSDLTASAPLHSWYLQPAISGLYRVSVESDTPGLLPSLAILDSKGTELVSESQAEESKAVSIIRLSEGERYTVIVSGGSGLGQGRYTLGVEPASVMLDGGVLLEALPDTGIISLADFTDTWSITPDSAEPTIVTVKAMTGDLALAVSLFDGEGNPIAEAEDAEQKGVELTIPSGSTDFTLLISRIGGGAGHTTGQYAIFVGSQTQ